MSKKLILGVLSTLFKMPELVVAEALQKSDGSEEFDEDKALKLIIDKDKDRIATIKAEGSTKWDDAYKSAEKKVRSKFEKQLKDRFDIEDTDLQGDELLDKVAETLEEKSKSTGKKPAEMTEDDIKKHPVFIKAEKDWKKALTDKETEKENALKKAEEGFTQKEVLSRAKKAAMLRFKAIGEAVLPSDVTRADNQVKKLLLDELEGFTFQEADGKFIVLDKDGKRVEDEHGHAQDFDALVDRIAKSNFDFKVAPERRSPANGGDPDKNKQPGEEKKYTGKAPSDKKEYLQLLTDENLSAEQKIEITGEYGDKF
jgi:hypothetical protein